MKEIIVKYSSGNKYPRTNLDGVSVAQAEQIINHIMPELQVFAGEYTWKLTGFSGEYEIHEEYKNQAGKKEYFVGGTGKTPAQALKRCYAIRHILKNNYGWAI